MNKEYLKVADKITNFLMNNQVITEDQEINLNENVKDYEDIPLFIKLIGTFSIKILRQDKDFFRYYIFITENKELFISQTKNFNNAYGPYKKGSFFRIEHPILNKNWTKKEIPKPQSRIYRIEKINLYKKRILFNLRVILNHLRKGETKLIKDLFNKIKKQKLDKEIKFYGGITWYFDSIKENKVKIISYDQGGIFDNNTNTQGDSFPPQVMGEYYADAYSAYCFAKKYIETKNQIFLTACIEALKFIKRTYEFYPSKIIWIHHDFKNPAFIETFNLIKSYLEKKDIINFEELIKKMREDMYEVTNIFALRYHWHTARNFLNYSKKSTKYYLKKVSRDQTREGLIHDNNIEGYNDAHDLTYHQYSLACLVRGLLYKENKLAKDIFLKGINFSLGILSPSGEVSYVGRGANNIYHLSSAIYAFEYASLISKNQNKFKKAAKLIFNYIRKWQQKDGSFPTALNESINERMAWNHCRTPYNALTAYFLYLASDISKETKEKETFDKTNWINIMDDSGYAVIKQNKHFLTIFSGCSKSYGWSGDIHHTGIAGIATLNSLTPILDESEILFTDIPSFIINNKKINCYGRGKLKEENGISYSKRLDKISFSRNYQIINDSLKITTKIKAIKKCNIETNLLSIPLLGKFKIKNNKLVINNQLEINSNWISKKDIIIKEGSNPRGSAKVLLFGPLTKEFKKNEEFSYVYSIKLL